MRKLFLATKSAFQNIIRHSLLSFTTITIMTMTILSITIVLMSNLVIHQALDVVEDKLNISIELHNGLSEDQILEFKDQLEAKTFIKNIDYISKENALIDFKNRFAAKENIINFVESINKNPLYASFTITTENSEEYQDLKEFLELPSFDYIIREIKNEKNQSEKINTFRDFSNNLRNVGIAVGIIFTSIALFIIFNTVKLGIHHRKQEIKIMKLVGAPLSSIILPFIIEGILYALLSMLLTLIAISSFLLWIGSSPIPLMTFIHQSLDSFYMTYKSKILLAQISLALAIGITSSYAAIFSYLKKQR